MKTFFLILIAALTLSAADATGIWTGNLIVDGQNRPAHLVLKQDGTKLTGTGGPTVDEQEAISNGKAEDGTLTFEVAHGERSMKFVLKLEGDEIKGDVTREADGQKQFAKLEVKREKK
jgi:hypothetical protein